MQIKTQPAILRVLFFTEMCERFGFYMIQGLFVLYMTSKIFNFSDAKSFSILGTFSAVSSMMPILGGYIATRFLDYKHAIIFGGVLLAIAYALLALPNENFFYIALAIISVGIGFFKPNINSYLGNFYHKNDPRREEGFTILYVGVNVGVILSTSISGYVVRAEGWHAPFLLASIGLIIGIMTFVCGIFYLKKTNQFHRINSSIATKNPFVITAVYSGAIFLTFISYEIIKHRVFADEFMVWSGCAIFIGMFCYAFRFDAAKRNKLIACILLILLSIAFWGIFLQITFSLNLFIQRAVDRQFFSLHLPTPFLFGLESIYIVILGPFFAMLWHTLSMKNKNISIPTKFTLAMFVMSAAFYIIYLGTKNVNVSGLSSMWFIVVAYLFLTISELLLSPTTFMMVTVLVPQELIGLMMGLCFVSFGLGAKLASSIADYAAIPKHIHLIAQIDVIYGDAFLHFTLLSFGGGIFFLLLTPILKKMIGKI